MSEFIDFTLKDASGQEHSYRGVPHGAIEGQEVMWQLVALGAEPVARLAQLALSSSNVRDLLNADGAKLQQILGGADFSTVGADVRKALVATNMSKLAREILRNTMRDGKPLSVDASGNGVFDQAYRANYGELLQAVWRVVQANRFLPLPGTS